jgi:hypothetical protein
MAVGGLSSPHGVSSPSSVSFDEVVRARSMDLANDAVAVPPDGDWRAFEERREAEHKERADSAWTRFEETQIEILGVYFGSFAPTGVALTRSRVWEPPGWIGRLLGRRWQARTRLHVALDLVTAGDAGDLVSQCERTAVKADQLLQVLSENGSCA